MRHFIVANHRARTTVDLFWCPFSLLVLGSSLTDEP